MSIATKSAVVAHAARHVQIGRWRIDFLQGGRFHMDGGVLFGVVPRRLWQMAHTPDAQNRLPCACNCFLLRDGRHTALIDAGYGGKHAPLDRKFYDLQAGEPLLAGLADLGVAPHEIDTVLVSHLHWDHVGGLTRRQAGALELVFPQARHVVGSWEWEDAHSGAEELAGSYPPENFAPLAGHRSLELIDDGAEPLPGVRMQITGGHTRGHMAIRIEDQGCSAMYLGDLCPSAAHLRRLWSLAYDLYPLEIRRNKPQYLAEAVERHSVILWTHDPQFAASQLGRDARGEFSLAETWPAV